MIRLSERAKRILTQVRLDVSDEVLRILSDQARDLNLCLRRTTATFNTGALRPSLPTKPGIIRCAGKEFTAPVPYVPARPPYILDAPMQGKLAPYCKKEKPHD